MLVVSVLVELGGAVFGLAAPLAAQMPRDCASFPQYDIQLLEQPGSSTVSINCPDQFRCYEAKQPSAPYVVKKVASCDATVTDCEVQARVPLEFPGNAQNDFVNFVFLYWFDTATAPASCMPRFDPVCGQIGNCGIAGLDGAILGDFAETFIGLSGDGLSCDDLSHPQLGLYSVSVFTCEVQSSCPKRLDIEVDLSARRVGAALGCTTPPPAACPAENSCTACKQAGDGGASTGGGGGSASPSGTGPVSPSYHAGGAGGNGVPGGSSLVAGGPRNAASGLGRHWSHRYAERIVEDPDETRVWLITRRATFREFTDLVGGVYETVSPSDEYRTLAR